jgi:hypothetical protein
MDRAIRASRLFRAEPAAIQPHVGVVQKLLAFHTNSVHRSMMIPAMDANHHFHRFPFAVQPLAGEINRFGFRHGLFSSHFHAVIFAHQPSGVFDASQSLG